MALHRIAVTAAILAGKHGEASDTSEQTTAFLVMGDWGGNQNAPYTTPAEVDTAKGMSTVAAALGAKFSLALGDNMYHSGVTSVDDKRFDETFEDVFTGEALSSKAGFEFHVVAGNHDHRGNISAEVAYSEKSQRWNFPSLYYTFTKTANDGATIQFAMIDTVIIAGNSHPEGCTVGVPGKDLPGPADKAAADAQIAWLEKTLAASTADYLIVAGHYPVYSVCEHGPTPILQQTVLPLMHKYKVSAYFAGHDHCAEHIDVDDGVQYHGIGSAAYHAKSETHIKTLKPGQLKYHDGSDGGGFASMLLTKKELRITHHDDHGKHLYNATVSPRTPSDGVVV